MKKGHIIFSVFLVLINLVALLTLNLSNNNFEKYIKVTYVLTVTFTLLLMIFRDKNYLKPSSLFSISVLMFVWNRVWISILSPQVIVLAGKEINDLNINRAILVIGGSVTITYIVNLLMNTKWEVVNFLFSKQETSFPKSINITIVLASIFFGLFFLLDSYKKTSLISALGYLEIAGTEVLGSGIKYFRMTKLVLLIWIFMGKNKKRFFYISIILFFSGLGFLMIGLRGYAIAYFFLFLYFFNQNKRIKFSRLFLLALALIYIANLILEYRMGFEVTSGLYNTIIDTLFQQGASFEVVYGSVVYRNELLSIFPLIDYLTKGNFGDYVDLVRGVGFEKGGFATTFYAEIYYFGTVSYIVLSVLMGVMINFLDYIDKCIVKSKENQYAQMLLFLTVPNLVYFARATAFDFLLKTVFSVLIIFFIKYFIKDRYNKGVLNENTI